MQRKTSQSGFTLLEMLLVIAIIAILASIVIIAINPGRQLAQARNAQRTSDIKSIYDAVNQYYVDNRTWPATFSSTLSEICDSDDEPSPCIDLETNLVPTYLSAIPSDPQSTEGTGYKISLGENNRLSLLATLSTEYSLPEVKIGNGDIIATNGLEHWWRPGTSGTGADQVGGVTLNLLGDAATVVDSGLELDGTGDYATFSINPSYENFSVAMWVYSDTYDKIWMTAIGSSNYTEIQMYSTGRNVRLLYNNTYDEVSTQTLINGTWNHIVFTFDTDNKARLYINGSPQTFGVYAGFSNWIGYINRFGRRTTNGNYDWNGIIDEMMIYSRAITQEEVDEIIANIPKP